MKRGKGTFKWTKVLAHWAQQILYLAPFIFATIVAVYIIKLTFDHHAPQFLDEMANSMQRRWNIAKDPDCRRPSSKGGIIDSNNIVVDYSEGIENLEQEENHAPTKIFKLEEIWKEPSLLNITDFQWIMNNESICKTDRKTPKDTRILPVLIHSSREHFTQREAVRKSWGSIPIYKKWSVRLVFLLGDFIDKPEDFETEEVLDNESSGDYTQSNTEEVKQKLEDEQDKYGDLVMGNFIESSKNLTYKHMMGYKWILNYCPNATFVMKADGDKFVDIIRWLDWRSKDMEILEKKSDHNSKRNKPEERRVPDLYCDVFSGATPVRDSESSYYASPQDWPEEKFPNYCSSWAYGTTVDLMKKLYAVSVERKFFWIDDVYFGALLQLAKEKFDWEPKINDCFKTHMGRAYRYREVCEENGHVHFEKTKEFGPVVHIGQGDRFTKDMMCLWNKTLHDSDYKFDKM